MENYHILIVDDDKDLSMIISDMLTGYGYHVTCAKDSEEAFSLLSCHAYHLLLLDINLPDSDGFALCRELRHIGVRPRTLILNFTFYVPLNS